MKAQRQQAAPRAQRRQRVRGGESCKAQRTAREGSSAGYARAAAKRGAQQRYGYTASRSVLMPRLSSLKKACSAAAALFRRLSRGGAAVKSPPSLVEQVHFSLFSRNAKPARLQRRQRVPPAHAACLFAPPASAALPAMILQGAVCVEGEVSSAEGGICCTTCSTSCPSSFLLWQLGRQAWRNPSAKQVGETRAGRVVLGERN